MDKQQLLEDLFRAYFDARRNKRNTINQLRFELNFESEVIALCDDILSCNYKVKPSICFIVDKPVKREIFAADFRDRVVHHLIFNYTNPYFDSLFIEDSYSCRKDKGTLYGINRVAGFVKECSDNYTSGCYILKLDIEGYFMNINRTLLSGIIKAQLDRFPELDKDIPFDRGLLYYLIDSILKDDPTQNCIIKGHRSDWDGLPSSKSLFNRQKNYGLPIGNLTSQLFSNVYLHNFDDFVKNELNIQYYGRYVDDFVIIHKDKQFLKDVQPKLALYLRDRLELKIHPKKVYLQHYSKGVNFLGAAIKPNRTYITNRTKKNFRKNVEWWEKYLSEERNVTVRSLNKLMMSLNSYLGIMGHHRTYNIRKKSLLSSKIPTIMKYGYIKCIPYKSMVYSLYKKRETMRFLLVAAGSFIFSANMSAQSVELGFPRFAGQEYHFWAFRGDGKDTIASGTLDGQGRAKLVLPPRMAGFRGMTQWQLTRGGGLDMIFAGGEDFSVSCPEAEPTEETIVYAGTRENTYLNARYQRQQDILGKIDAMRMAADAYRGDSALLAVFEGERQKQELAYRLLQEETAANPLYAARFAQIVDVTRGLPPVLASGQDDTAGLLKDFVVDGLDIDALYTSGHWQGVLEQLMDWYSYKEEARQAFIPDMIRLIRRAVSDEVYAALAEKVIVFCEKKDWHNGQIEFAFFLQNDDRIKEPEGKLASVYTLLKIRKGAKAPALVQGGLPTGKFLLVFYESGCNACDNEMQSLKGNYPLLKAKGYEVVSVAADKDAVVFRNTAGTFPWKAKYCDFQGFAGRDFINYGVVGTPTFYVIDEKGVLQGRYARLFDTGILK